MQHSTQLQRSYTSLLMWIVSIMVGLPLVSCSQSNSEVTLDGKTFTVITMEKGKPETSALETITFTKDQFDNIGCHIWGFGSGTYTITADGDNYHFEATTHSDKEGDMLWKGMLMGDILHGEMIWKKEGNADIIYTFDSRNITMVNLDGRAFHVSFTDQDTVIQETISFSEGKMESPGCYVYGFSASPYQAWESAGNIQWQSLYESALEGKMLFTGTIQGKLVSGYQFWTKNGQADIYYPMNGEEVY